MIRRFLISVFEVAEIALITIVTVVIIRTFLVQPFIVSGASMDPNFANGDYLLIDELTYRLRLPERGEVAVFRYPDNQSTFFIKRIIGLPGERVVIWDGKVRIFNEEYPEGFLLKEDYLPASLATLPRANGKTEFNVSPGEYFVLGDNRSQSFDSRDWGLLARSDIVGLARVRLWPIGTLHAFAAPNYEI